MAKPLTHIIVVALLISTCIFLALLVPRTWAFLEDRPANNMLVYLMAHEATIYSKVYSERRFARVKHGMRRKEVENLLGPPLRILEASRERIIRSIEYQAGADKLVSPDLVADAGSEISKIIYYYTLPAGATADWHVRIVTFNKDDVVVDVEKDFYVD